MFKQHHHTITIFIICIACIISSKDLIIANTTEKSLSAENIKQIYLGKIARWKNGDKIILTVLESGKTHESFMNNCLNKKSRSFNLYWKQRMFTGRGVMPTSFHTEKELINFIKNTEGSIGYISDSLKDSITNDITIINICEYK